MREGNFGVMANFMKNIAVWVFGKLRNSGLCGEMQQNIFEFNR